MKTEPAILGLFVLIVAVIVYLKTELVGLAILLAVLGLALIVFSKEEDTIEQRKDIKTKKNKK